MKNLLLLTIVCLWVGLGSTPLRAQVAANCTDGTVVGSTTYSGTVFFNYGSATNAFTTKNRTTASLGEAFIGPYLGVTNNGVAGFYSRFLLPPSAPLVYGSEGDLTDRIKVSWVVDPLSPSAELGFNIYRDGAFLGRVEKEARVYVDFNVQAGKFYNYQVSGVSNFGEGSRGSGLGFLNPNGIVTGQVTTQNGNPVVDAAITLTPTLGTALNFTGDDVAFAEYSAQFHAPAWSMSAWVKIGNGNSTSSILDFGSATFNNWWLSTNGASKGVQFSIGTGAAAQSVSHNFATDPDGWHHVAATYSGSSLLLYVDGNLVSTLNAALSSANLPLFFGRKPTMSGYFTGGLDDVRLFRRQLSQTEINAYKNRTVNSDATGLAAYWKFDEGVGSKAYDISPNSHVAYLCGSEWSNDRPEVVNGAVTDETGFYKIEGINYGSGTIFTATPSKKVFDNYALEFNAANSNYAVLTDSILLGGPQNAAVELWVQSFENTVAARTLLANQSANGATNFFRLDVENGDLKLYLNGPTPQSFGALGTGYQHLIFSLKKVGADTEVSLYKNGGAAVLRTYTSVLPNFGPQTWRIGARKTAASHDQFFSGLMDEVAFYDSTLTQVEAQSNFAGGVAAGHLRLRSWFSLNESRGTVIEDLGPARTGKGTVVGALWSSVTGISSAIMHEFQPDKQLVTLNASNTSADKINFTDLSTVRVSGFVRFQGTNCFEPDVEILGNGVSFIPPVFTNAQGAFVVDLEPGTSVTLTPKASFGNHIFTPSFWEVKNVFAPVAGILFNDQTKYFIEGQVAGGKCRKSIIPPGSTVTVELTSLDGCYSATKTLNHADNANGKFKFSNLPPIRYAVAFTDHSTSVGPGSIKQYFLDKGGENVDLRERSDTIDFIYFASPNVEISEFGEDPLACFVATDPSSYTGAKILGFSELYSTNIKVYQDYYGEKCYLDTAALSFFNGISEVSQFDTMLTQNQRLTYRFRAGQANIVPPYLKTLQVTATADGRSASTTQKVVVLGDRARAQTFATTSPEIPVLILRDPPGDASYAYMEKGKKICKEWSFEYVKDESNGVAEKVSIGPRWTVSVGVIGVFTGTETDIVAETEGDFDWTKKYQSNQSTSVCFSTDEVLSTASDDILTGPDADVFMGGALNILFGQTDRLQFDTANPCLLVLKNNTIIVPGDFATTYVYSRYFILNELIPTLQALGTPTALASMAAWQNIIQYDSLLQANSKTLLPASLPPGQSSFVSFDKNLSFNGGASYQYSTTYEANGANSISLGELVDKTTLTQLGLFANDVGASIGHRFNLVTQDVTTNGVDSTNTTTAGYVLQDDDPGDNFTVDILQDNVYGTHIFKTVAGQSSCPFEVNTQPREEVTLVSDKFSVSDVPETSAATFTFTLGNISQSDDTRTYIFGLKAGSNPLGAVVSINGGGAEQAFQIKVGQPQEVIVTISRANKTSAFDYEDLEFALYSGCENQRAIALDLDEIDPKFYKSILLDAHFVPSCSYVDLDLPVQNWTVTNITGPNLNVRVSDYDKNDPDLDAIRVQYRRVQDNGTPINILPNPITKAELQALPGNAYPLVWNTTGLKDGEYEIRAVSECPGNLKGFSRIIKGKIERTAPEIFGTPEPADGVLSLGDEISITFTESIRCDLIIPADLTQNNNVGLYDVATGELIDATITCSGEKIVIVPNVANQFIQGKFLRVEVDNIKDLVNNNFVHAEWTFFVNRSLLDHEGGDLVVTMYEGEEKTELRTLTNVGGAIATFKITGSPSLPLIPNPAPVPAWATIYPNLGSLLPGEETVVTYKFDKSLPQGLYRDTIYFNNGQGDERVIINLRVLCPPPLWVFDEKAYPHTMNLTVELNIEGTLSSDEEDIVAAFIGGELRGTAKIRHLPTLPGTVANKYRAFLTVYANDDDEDEPIDLEIWDASACLRYDQVVEQFDFEIDRVWGNLTAPITLHTNSMIRRDIPITTGWNWLSFNLVFPNPAPTAALASLQHPQNDLIKSQTAFSEYFGSAWVGSLATLNNRSMYQYRADQPDTLQMVGALIDPASLSIPIAAGWNWIGYVPNYALAVTDALAGLSPLNGDIIKGQTAFAQYLAGVGWLGSLQFMEPPKGYQLKISNAGALTYPPQPPNRPSSLSSLGHSVTGEPESQHNSSLITHHFWAVDATLFEHSMTLVGMFSASGQNATLAGHEIGAFAGGQLRGSAQAIYIEPLGAYQFFLTTYANAQGEQLQFRLYDSATGAVQDLAEKMYFVSDLHQGSIQSPVPFTLKISGLGEVNAEQYMDVSPNPFSDATTVRFASEQAQEVRLLVSDVAGRTVLSQKIAAVPGMNTFRWEAAPASAGVYFVRLETGEGTAVRKVVKE